MRIAIIGSTESRTQILMNCPANKTIHRIQLPSRVCRILCRTVCVHAGRIDGVVLSPFLLLVPFARFMVCTLNGRRVRVFGFRYCCNNEVHISIFVRMMCRSLRVSHCTRLWVFAKRTHFYL